VYHNECLAPSTSAEYKAPVHAVVGTAGKDLHGNGRSEAKERGIDKDRLRFESTCRQVSRSQGTHSFPPFSLSIDPLLLPPVLATPPAIFEHVDTGHFGLTLMTVNRTHLTLTLYSDEEGGNVLDTFTLLTKGGG